MISAASTRAPASTNRSTLARPMPEAAPVITATLPSRLILMVILLPASNIQREPMSTNPKFEK